MNKCNAIRTDTSETILNIDPAVNNALYVDEEFLDFDPDAEILRRAKRADEIFEHQIADSEKIGLNIPSSGQGPIVYIGFDSEFVSGHEEVIKPSNSDSDKKVANVKSKVKPQRIRHDNKVLSLQFYLIGEDQMVFTKVIPLKNGTKANRPSFNRTIINLVDAAMDEGSILEWPEQIVLCGFFLRIDLPAFGDFTKFKHDLQNSSGRVAGHSTITDENVDSCAEESEEEPVSLRPKTILAKDRSGIFRTLKVRFIDVGGHVEIGTSLAQIGELLGLPKLKLPDGFSKDKMDVFQKEKQKEFNEYGLRDSEIAVRFFLKLQDFANTVLKPSKTEGKIRNLPTTASSLAVKMFVEQMEQIGESAGKTKERFNKAFGVKDVSSPYCDINTGLIRTHTDKQPIPMRAIFEPFVADCYNGGRNECYVFGPTDVGIYNDFDLAGAYTTGMVDLLHIDYENFRTTKDTSDFVGHVLGFAYVDFAFPDGTRYPCLPVRTRSNSLIYPMTGFSYCTAPEVEVALRLGCEIKIKYGIIIPWLEGDSQRDSDTRLFEPFVTSIRKLRAQHEPKSLDERYAKLLGNSVYGKTAQGLRKRTVFDAKKLANTALPASLITNAAIAAHATGFIRAALSELVASVPEHRKVISATTDGFLTDADESELNLDGPMVKRYLALCERVAPGTKWLERKHKVQQLIAMKTRGQLTLIPCEGEPIILAKAGVSPDIKVEKYEDATKDEFTKIQNEYMVDLFLSRRPSEETQTQPFVSFRDQWMKDGDVIRLTQTKRLNLEFDIKRRLVNPRMIPANQSEHIALDSVPWKNLEEFERARAIFDGWRRANCLKTLADYENWNDLYQFYIVRDGLKRNGIKGVEVRATEKGVPDVFRRLFLRAYVQGLCGLAKTMTNAALAEWLTKQDYPTTVDELKNAKRAKFVEHAIPATRRVLELAKVLEAEFPSIQLCKFFETNLEVSQ